MANDEVESVTSEVLFAHRGWTVEENENGNFDILDQDSVTDEATTLEEATEACRDGAEEAYRQRLIEEIEMVGFGDLEVDDLELIAKHLSIDLKMV
jgi:hypothetical protein